MDGDVQLPINSRTVRLTNLGKIFWSDEGITKGDLLRYYASVAKRPHGRVLVDYNQNAWGRTLASVYSPRPRPKATVSTPVMWEEVEQGLRIEDFTIENVPERVRRLGDLWRPLLANENRFALETML